MYQSKITSLSSHCLQNQQSHISGRNVRALYLIHVFQDWKNRLRVFKCEQRYGRDTKPLNVLLH